MYKTYDLICNRDIATKYITDYWFTNRVTFYVRVNKADVRHHQ